MTDETALIDYSQSPVSAVNLADRWLKLANIAALPEPHRERLLNLKPHPQIRFLIAFPEIVFALLADDRDLLDATEREEAREAVRATAQACLSGNFSRKADRWAELMNWASGATDTVPEVAAEYRDAPIGSD